MGRFLIANHGRCADTDDVAVLVVGVGVDRAITADLDGHTGNLVCGLSVGVQLVGICLGGESIIVVLGGQGRYSAQIIIVIIQCTVPGGNVKGTEILSP